MAEKNELNAEGLHKAAILMLSLGEEAAAKVIQSLSPRDALKVSQMMAKMKPVPHQEVNSVLQAFKTSSDKHRMAIGRDSDDYVRQALIRAFGEEKASAILPRILGETNISGIESLKWLDSVTVSELIHNEHPQIIATILAHLEPEQASEILSHFTERLRNDVILRIVTMERIQPGALTELNDVLSSLLAGHENQGKTSLGGSKAAAEILNLMNSEMELKVMEALKNHDPEMAQKIMDEMFVFSNLLDLDDRSIQLVLRETQAESLIIALKGATEELREKFFRNMSSRGAEMMKEDLQSRGPIRKSDAEAEQKNILTIVRRLADEGSIVLGGKGDDSFV